MRAFLGQLGKWRGWGEGSHLYLLYDSTRVRDQGAGRVWKAGLMTDAANLRCARTVPIFITETSRAWEAGVIIPALWMRALRLGEIEGFFQACRVRG